MMDIPSRHRPLALLAGVVLVQLVLLAFQIKRQHEVRLIRVWSVELLTPLQRAGTWLFHGVGGSWRHYIDLRDARVENERLHSELGRLQLRNRELESRAAEEERLAKLLNFRESHLDVPMVAAQVIGASADAASRTIYVNRGERDGLRRNMGVITPDGVVGKVVEVFMSSAQVLLITDKESGVGALLEGSRTHGVIKGTGEPFLRLEYVINDENVPNGAQVLTSGEDRIFPKDLPAGTVVATQAGTPFKVIRLQPAAHLDRIEEVLVLLAPKEIMPKKEAETAGAKPGTASPANPPKSTTPPAAGSSKPAPQKPLPPQGTGTGTSDAGQAAASPTAKKPAANSANTSAAAGATPSNAAPQKTLPQTGAAPSTTAQKKTPPAPKKPAANSPGNASANAPKDAQKKEPPPDKPADKPAETTPPADKPPAPPQPQ